MKSERREEELIGKRPDYWRGLKSIGKYQREATERRSTARFNN